LRSQGTHTPPPPANAAQRAVQRAQAIAQDRSLARAGQPNPIAADEARRLGERVDPEPEAGPATIADAVAALCAVLPVASVEEWVQQPGGSWWCRQTGETAQTCPI